MLANTLTTLFQTIRPDEPYCNIYNADTSRTRSNKLKGTEPAIVDYVAVDTKNRKCLQKVNRFYLVCFYFVLCSAVLWLTLRLSTIFFFLIRLIYVFAVQEILSLVINSAVGMARKVFVLSYGQTLICHSQELLECDQILSSTRMHFLHVWQSLCFWNLLLPRYYCASVCIGLEFLCIFILHMLCVASLILGWTRW